MSNQTIVSRSQTWKRFASEEFDVCIIGGGITGAGIVRDAALRGLKVALIEKKDFGWGTSSRSSKLIHGGLRYLEHYKFGLVKESLRERVVLMKIAPHIIHPLPFLIPIYKGEKPPAILMRLGLFFYDFLSIGKRVGRRSWIKSKRAIELEPNLRSEGLKGIGKYFDCQMNDSRLTLENILSAQNLGAVLLNYSEAVSFRTDNGRLSAVLVRNLETQEETEIRAKVFVNAGGPWADSICKMENPNAKRKLANSKGSHFITKKKFSDNAIVIALKDGRIVFVLPWGSDYSLIGTTDTFYEDDIDNIYCSEEDLEYLIEGVNRFFPSIPLSRDDILSTYAGVRPLVYDEKKGADASDVSREHKIFTSDNGLISIIGGKYTTYRKMGKTITDLVVKKLKKQKQLPDSIEKCLTDKLPLFGGDIHDWEDYFWSESKDLTDKYKLPDDIVPRLLGIYGSKLNVVLSLGEENEDWLTRLLPDHPYLKVQVIYAIRFEMARSLDDFFWRRTFFFLETNIDSCLDDVAKLFASELEWDEEKMEIEKTAVQNLIAKNRL
ncbi:MAG: glycerol-3-phosphate dehydrogenase [Candidatus Hodarchaeales archaeon]|jgi:glycerol-3-phosphate dehydrogenase